MFIRVSPILSGLTLVVLSGGVNTPVKADCYLYDKLFGVLQRGISFKSNNGPPQPYRSFFLACPPLWVFDLLCDEVERVPSGVGEQSGVQSQSDVSWVLRGAVKHTIKVLGVTWKMKIYI